MKLQGKRVALVVANRYADREFWYPYYRLKEAGASVDIVGPDGAQFTGRHGIPVQAERMITALTPTDYDAVIIPGADIGRMERQLVRFTRSLLRQGGVVAAIGEGTRILATADIVEGRRVTGFRGVRDSLEGAGARWVEQEVVSDGNVITSRTQADLPAFCRALTDTLS